MKTEKRIDENLYSEKSLYLLNIKELRDLGRKIGVPAPATLKKQDLVDYILKIVYGEVDVPKRSSFGRPNVREVNIDQYLSKIKKRTDYNDELLSASFGDVESIFKVASPEKPISARNVEQRIFVEDNKKYYLRRFGFVASDGDIEVSKQIKEKYNLADYDVVEAIICGRLFKIVSINGKVVIHKNSLSEGYFGVKQVFHLSTKEKIKNEIIKQIEFCKSRGFKAIVCSQQDFSDKNIDYIQIKEDECIEAKYKKFMTYVCACEKYAFEGETIAAILDNSDFIEDVINSLDEEVAERTKKHLQSRIDDFLALGNALLIYKQDVEVIYQ